FISICFVSIRLLSSLLDFYSYSLAAGDGSGTEYSTAHAGRITGIRIWEYSNAHIGGIQLSYDGNWTTLVCANYGTPMVSGKYDYGQSFKVGQPSGNSFNFYPTHDGSELHFLSEFWGALWRSGHWRALWRSRAG
uniref:Jacalin-type lectin domain-containing protein n=1 Tax=Sinocyclocheilus rhinocerous TaxID=307959 RepID=A0A673HC60_9TELE